MFPRADGDSDFASIVADSLGQFWASNLTVYRASESNPSQQAIFSYGADGGTAPGQLVIDPSGQNLYFVSSAPRPSGVFTVDPATGVGTLESWNLDLVPLDSIVSAVAYANR